MRPKLNKSSIKIIKDKDYTTFDVSIPKDFKLYRLRSDNDYCFSAFMNDEIWGTVPEGFNDPYDTVSIFHAKELYLYAKYKLDNDIELVSTLCAINDVENDKKASYKLSKILVDYLFSNDSILKQKVTVSACFTEKIDNELMWAHYANNAKGFALEYDYYSLKEFADMVEKNNNQFIKNNFNIFDLNEDYSMPSTIVPIIYNDSKYDMTNYLKKVIDNELNNVREVYIFKRDITLGKSLVNLIESTKEFRLDSNSFWKMNCFKKKDWKYEREWRLLAYNINPLFLNQSIVT